LGYSICEASLDRRRRPICSRHRDLEEWVADGYIQIDEGPAKGRYRVIGVVHNHPILEAEGVKISVDLRNKDLILNDSSTDQLVQKLRYESLSGDWAFASFSDDASVIAVLVPYRITFFSVVPFRG
jgi:hypothetical protein